MIYGGSTMKNAMEFNENNFENEVLNSDIPVLIDFWAEWCHPCKMIAPVVSDIADEYKGKFKVGKINVDFNQNLAVKYGISGIPSLLLFKNGEIIDSIVGVVPKNVITDKMNYYLNGTAN